MRVLEFQLSQALRFVPIAGLQGKLYGPNLARPFEQRYGFLQGPQTVEQWDLSKGISFLHGFFENTLIQKFSLFPDGLVCETNGDTSVADRFIDDVIKWAREAGGFPIPEAVHQKAYLSRLNVQMDVALDKAIDGLAEFGQQLAKAVNSYGRYRVDDYGVAGLHFHVDHGAQGGLAPPPFLFERTVNQPYSTRSYFSSAALSTADHTRILEMLEHALSRL